MNDVKTLVMMQLTDKLDFSFVRDRPALIRRIVFFILRFLIVTLVALGLFFLASFLKIFHNSPYLPTSVMTMVLSTHAGHFDLPVAPMGSSRRFIWPKTIRCWSPIPVSANPHIPIE
jgi:hypothetical protein